jgi:hypothetical protein
MTQQQMVTEFEMIHQNSFVYLARTKLTNFIVKDIRPSIEVLIDLCLAMVTYDQGRYEKSIQLFDKVF